MTLADAVSHLEWLADHQAQLWDARLYGTPPRWREKQLTREQHEQAAELARAEAAEVDERAPGWSRAPLRVDVLDLHDHIVSKAQALRVIVAEHVGDIRTNRDLAALADMLPGADTITQERVAEWATAVRDRVRAILGEVEDGQTLKGLCPFCLGVGPNTPAGGAYTIRFRSVPRPTRADRDATEMLAVCESGTCNPLAAECSIWLRGNPAWAYHDWEWLAKRMRAVS